MLQRIADESTRLVGAEPNDTYYLAVARAARAETFARIDPRFGALLGMKLEGNEPRIASLAETEAALAREAAKDRYVYYSGAGVWDNAGGRAVDAASFARHWAEGKIAHGDAPGNHGAPGHPLGELWSAFLLPRPAFEGSRDKMAFLQSVLDDPELSGNAKLREWVARKRDEFARQVQEGLKSLSQDIVMMMSHDVIDPLAGPDRVLSLANHLRLVTGEKTVGEIRGALETHASALGITPAQSARLRSIAQRFPRIEADREGIARNVEFLIDHTLQKSRQYPSEMVNYLLRQYDPLHHPPALAHLRLGDKINTEKRIGVFLGIGQRGIRVRDGAGAIEEVPFTQLPQHLSILAKAPGDGRLVKVTEPRLWSILEDKDPDAKVPTHIGRIVGDDGNGLTYWIETPGGGVRKVASKIGFLVSPVAFDAPSLPSSRVHRGHTTPADRWRTIEGTLVVTEGPGSFFSYEPDGKAGRKVFARWVEATDGSWQAHQGLIRAARPDGTTFFLSEAEFKSATPADPREAIAKFLRALPAPRREVVRRFQGGAPAAFPDREAVHVSTDRRNGVISSSFAHDSVELALKAKERYNGSHRLTAEAPLPGMINRKYLIDEYIGLPVDRPRIERLRPGTRYAWVLLADGDLRLCPEAGMKDAQLALAEGRNVLSAGVLEVAGTPAAEHLRVTLGHPPHYYRGRSDRARLAREAGHAAFAFERLAGSKPESVDFHLDRSPSPPDGKAGVHLSATLSAAAARLAERKPLTKRQAAAHEAWLAERTREGDRPGGIYNQRIATQIGHLLKGNPDLFEKWLDWGLKYGRIANTLSTDRALRRSVLEHFLLTARRSGKWNRLTDFYWDLESPDDARFLHQMLADTDSVEAQQAKRILRFLAPLYPEVVKRDFPGILPPR